LLNKTVATFFTDGIMHELCESGQCNVDQRSFKAYLSRWLAATYRLAPITKDIIQPLLKTSAAAAVKTCSGGTGSQCGLKWNTGSFDGSFGVGEQMAVLEVVQGNLISEVPDWVSKVKGTGNSTGNVDAGQNSLTADTVIMKPATTKDRIGAAFFTALILIGVVGGSATMMISE
jgi:mannan endo-1,6-alpha-mannosidase